MFSPQDLHEATITAELFLHICWWDYENNIVLCKKKDYIATIKHLTVDFIEILERITKITNLSGLYQRNGLQNIWGKDFLRFYFILFYFSLQNSNLIIMFTCILKNHILLHRESKYCFFHAVVGVVFHQNQMNFMSVGWFDGIFTTTLNTLHLELSTNV